MPVEFCAALTKQFGVNPAWLVTGEGAPFLSDMAIDTASMAGSVLELVGAMNAVTRMKLGELAGKRHLEVLRELNDQLVAYEDGREKLRERIRPVCEDLLEGMASAMRANEFKRAGVLRNALMQVLRLCPDEEMEQRFDGLRARLAVLSEDAASAAEFSRKVFLRHVARGGIEDEATCRSSYHYALSLYRLGRLKELRRVANAVVHLVGKPRYEWESYLMLCAVRALVEIELGHATRGMTLLEKVLPQGIKPLLNPGNVPMIARMRLLTGTMTFEHADGMMPPGPHKTPVLAMFACWTEDPAHIERALASATEYTREREVQAAAYFQCRRLGDAIAGNTDAALAEPAPPARWHWDGKSPDHGAEFTRLVCHSQILARLDRHDEALAATLRASEELGTIPSNLTIDVLLLAIHWRNILRLATSRASDSVALTRLHRRAARFFRLRARRGFGLFLSMVKQGQGPQKNL